jgi:DNA-binding NtrC family response regulator
MSVLANLLVIDDEPKLRATLALIINSAGYKVTTLGDAKSALEFLSNSNYDLVILDWQLNNHEEPYLLKSIHQLYPNLPVIVITGNASQEVRNSAMQLGARYFLSKPFDPVLIISVVNDILRKDKVLRPGPELFKDAQPGFSHF